ncbi:hypothetical protein ASPZODRAFT_319611 [Penicilliopsis zonata CBS 506.65]|uniref:Uncharacterized protein n=1 Tax=Penicilliopsis zonata CBS 506.65 TaxID=1073090 RepID=A0A1L9SVJ6_9EURO|nr:hypothetical protein ASPZODRAFT_319611 [Penicilliopsis zonata CBS 506.65]OJJ51107.1 hypothetical protein ASPZODRAFT_319611 [Penicilliopsis zonata CBS 506.65]
MSLNDDQNPPPYYDPANSSETRDKEALQRLYGLTLRPELVVKPDPITMYLGFGGHRLWSSIFIASLNNRMTNISTIVQRPVSQEELDAVTEHVSRSVYGQRIGLPLGLAMGSLHTYANLAALKQTGAKWPSFSGVMSFANMRLRTEPRTLLFSYGFRLLFWTTVGWTGTGAYATLRETQATIVDPRMRGFVDELRHMKPEELRRRKLEAAQNRTRRARQPSDVQEEDHTHGVLAESHEEHNNRDYSYPYSADTDDKVSSRPSPDQPRSMPDRSNTRLWGNEATAPAPSLSSSSSRDAMDFFDDASPTNPEYRDDGPGTSYGGSAWDRIRQQNMATSGRAEHFRSPQDWQQQEPQQPESPRDKQREREQAQADFDRVLEAERNIGDPSGRGGSNRGWGS